MDNRSLAFIATEQTKNQGLSSQQAQINGAKPMEDSGFNKVLSNEMQHEPKAKPKTKMKPKQAEQSQPQQKQDTAPKQKAEQGGSSAPEGGTNQPQDKQANNSQGQGNQTNAQGGQQEQKQTTAQTSSTSTEEKSATDVVAMDNQAVSVAATTITQKLQQSFIGVSGQTLQGDGNAQVSATEISINNTKVLSSTAGDTGLNTALLQGNQGQQAAQTTQTTMVGNSELANELAGLMRNKMTVSTGQGEQGQSTQGLAQTQATEQVQVAQSTVNTNQVLNTEVQKVVAAQQGTQQIDASELAATNTKLDTAGDKGKVSLSGINANAKQADGQLEGLMKTQAMSQGAEIARIVQGDDKSFANALKASNSQMKVDAALNVNNALGVNAANSKAQATMQLGANSTTVKVPVGQQNWAPSVFERVMFLSNQGIKSAEIALNPPELGPLQVSVRVNNDQASVFFSSQHGQVREALEMAAPKLREMLESQGLNLANVDVSDRSLAEHQNMDEDGELSKFSAGHYATEDEVVDEDDLLSAIEAGVRQVGQIDAYA